MRSIVLLSCLAAAVHAQGVVEQIHIFQPEAGSMHISWATRGPGVTSETVQYGLTPKLGLQVTGNSTVFSKNMTTALRLHDVTLTGLGAANTPYYYSIGGNSTVYSFVNAASRPGGKMYLVLADLGLANDVALSPLIEATAAGDFDAVLHSGDFAYDLEDEFGENGNAFMNSIQQISATLSYTPAPGNHEADADFSFAQYQARFAGAGQTAGVASASFTSLYYSYDDGLAHIVVIDTEQYYYDENGVSLQYTWLQADLAAVDRTVTPWLIVLGHKGYWMTHTDWKTYSDLFHQYGVDLFLGGHQHNYNRLYPVGHKLDAHPECVDTTGPVPVYNPCENRTITLITGSPGCVSGIDNTTAPSDALAAQIFAYGYGRLQIVNATTAHYWWLETVTVDESGAFVRVPLATAATDEAWFNRASN